MLPLSRWIVKIAMALLFAIGSVVLVGWTFPVTEGVTRPLDWLTVMPPQAAVGFLLAGGGIGAIWGNRWGGQSQGHYWHWSAWGLSVLLGGLTLLGWLQLPLLGGLSSDAVSPLTRVNFLLVAIALPLLIWPTGWRLWTVQSLAVGIGLGSIASLVSQVLGGLDGAAPLPPGLMSGPTAIAFLLSSLALLEMYPQQGLMQVIHSPLMGGQMARRLLPLVIVLPVLVHLVTHQGQRRQWYGPITTEVLQVLAAVGMLSVAVWWTARSLNQIEQQQRQLEGELRRANESLEARVRNRTNELAAVNARLNFLITASPAVIFSCETEGDYGATYVSENIHQVLGYEAQEFLAEPGFWLAHVHPDDRDRVQQELAPLAQTGISAHEYRFLHGDGTYRWLYSHIRLITPPNAPAEIVGYLVDITDRKQTEASLQASERHFRQLIRDLNLGITVYNAQAEFQFCNPKALELLMLSEDQLAGRIVTDPAWQIIHEDGTPFLPETFPVAQAIAQGEPIRNAVMGVLRSRADGTAPEPGWLLVSAEPQTNAAGNLQQVICTFIDITALKQAQQALQHSEERFRAIFDQTFQFCGLLSPEGTLLQINQSALDFCGITEVDVVGQPLWDIPCFVSSPVEQRQLQLAIARTAQGELMRFEVALLNQQHQPATVDFSLKPLRDPAGQVVMLIAEGRDISDRKALEVALAASEAQLQHILDSAIAAIICLRVFPDRRYVYEYCSDGCERVFGYTDEELLADTTLWASHIHPDDRASVLATILEQILANQTSTIEYRFLHKNGTYRWIADTYTAHRDTATDSWLVTTVATDITERKRVEEGLALQAKRERLLLATTQRVRESLALEDVLQTTVQEVQQLLNPDCVRICQVDYGSGRIISEAFARPCDAMGQQDECAACGLLNDPELQQGRIRVIPDITQMDLPNPYQQFLARWNIGAVLIVPILVGARLWGLLLVHEEAAPRQWHNWEVTLLQQLAVQVGVAIQQSALYQQTQQQAEREQALNRVIQAIRDSLDLDTTFATATREIGYLLDVERTVIAQYAPATASWQTIAGYYKPDDWSGALGTVISDRGNQPAQQLKRGEIIQIADTQEMADDPLYGPLAAAFPGAWLIVPLAVNQQTWGALILVRSQPAPWQDVEVRLTQTIATQLGIAIQQSELYQKIQQLNANLEAKVTQRTQQLEQALEFEALLKRITDKVRDSLDEAYILQTAVAELAIGLSVRCCDAALYDLEQGLSTICYEFVTPGFPKGQGNICKMHHLDAVYSQIRQGRWVQFCIIPPFNHSPRTTDQRFAMLACPVQHDQELLGDLWLFREMGATFSEAEVRLCLQVANQCAIALRQSRLYQRAQAQVEELERLNHLKDDFLSTVSHELRTPMSNMRMALKMLEVSLERTPLPEGERNPIHRYYKILDEECQREITLINDLLDLARLDAASEPLNLTPIQLQFWLPHLTEPFLNRLQNQQQQLKIDIADSLPPFTTDLSYLERCLSELLNNACKYTPAQATIALYAQPHEQGVEIRVCNSGIELPPIECDRIFEKFYRIPNNDPWKHGGTGLGLALVGKLIERLKGNIRVESANQWVNFILQLPDLANLDA